MAEIEKVRADVEAATAPTGAQRSSIVPELSAVNLGLPGWSHFMPPERELAPAWVGKQRTQTVEAMLNDSQVDSLRQAVRLPAHRYVVELDPGDAPADLVPPLAADLDVPVVGAADELPPGRRADRFSSRRHLDRVLDALDYGHAVFEHAGRIDEEGRWRLTDLAPVPQWTIDDDNSWEIDRFGRLVQVVQRHTSPPTELPVDRLAVFTWQGRAGDPRGRPILRSLYGMWLLRDRTLRVNGMSSERTGMGIPVGKVAPGAADAKAKMSLLLSRLAAGEDTELVIESDKPIAESLMLMGVTGTTPNLVESLRYYDECMARKMLAMVIQLGQTQTGSRALGNTFDDLLADFHDAVLAWYCDVMTAQVVEPWIDRNRLDAAAPRLVWRRREPGDPDGTDPDEPAQPDPLDPAQAPEPIAARRAAQLARRRRAVRASFGVIAGRELRREPTDAELASHADFAQLESQHVASRQALAEVLLRDRSELADVAVESVAGMPTVDPLTLGATLAQVLGDHAAGMDTEPIVTTLAATAAAGVTQVIGEAARQGVALDASVDYDARAEAEARDLLRRMAVQVAESAAASARTIVPATGARRGRMPWRRAALAAGEADAIGEHLSSLAPAMPERAAAGAASRAMNAGREAALEVAPVQSITSSELLDENTCGPCEDVDGTEYDSLEDALGDYPGGGGYVGCEGMEACRGTLVATMGDEQAAQA